MTVSSACVRFVNCAVSYEENKTDEYLSVSHESSDYIIIVLRILKPNELPK